MRNLSRLTLSESLQNSPQSLGSINRELTQLEPATRTNDLQEMWDPTPPNEVASRSTLRRVLNRKSGSTSSKRPSPSASDNSFLGLTPDDWQKAGKLA